MLLFILLLYMFCYDKASVVALFTCVVQVEGQHEVQEDVRQLLCGIRGKPVLHHAQKKLNKVCIQVF